MAANGQLGLEVLHQHCRLNSAACPVLVLLDLNMPVMNGLEFLEVLPHQPLSPPQSW